MAIMHTKPLIIGLCLVGLFSLPAQAQSGSLVKVFTDGMVWRNSQEHDQGDSKLPKTTIANVFFDTKPAVSSQVTIVPLGVDIPAFPLKIVRAVSQKSCGQEKHWQVGLEPIHEAKIAQVKISGRNDEFPFDVAVLYPAVNVAHAIGPSNLSKGMLPKDVAKETVFAAVDSTDDGQPDFIITHYCCEQPSQPANTCELTCSATYQKTAKGWKRSHTSRPC